MKKKIFILCVVLASLSIVTFGYMNQNPMECKPEPDFFHGVDSRFNTTITKEELHNAKSIRDILPARAFNNVVSYETVRVSTVYTDPESYSVVYADPAKSAEGSTYELNAEQLSIIRSASYSTNLCIRVDHKSRDTDSGELRDNYLQWFLTVVPENKAQYEGGEEAILTFLEEQSRQKIANLDRNKLSPGKVSFTVSKTGTIEDVHLTYPSGYPSVDSHLIDLVKVMPGRWKPASNSQGEQVGQEFVVFYGVEGC